MHQPVPRALRAHGVMLRRPLALARWPDLVYPAAVLLGLTLPFAAIPPIVATPWLSLSDDKLIFLLLVAAWLTQGRRLLPGLGEWRMVLPSLVFVLVVLLSARFAAPDYAMEGLHYASRLLAAGFVMLVAMRLRSDARQMRGVLWAVVVGGGLSAVLGMGEALRWPQFTPVLSLFKIAPTRVADDLRVGASFQYATIASMYFEMVAPLAIVLAATARARRTQLLASGVAILCTADVVLSLTRAGILTLGVMFVALLIVGIVNTRQRSLLIPTVLTTGALLGGVGLLLARDPVFDLRLATESDADWYGAVYSAPRTLTLPAGGTAIVDLDVQNEGRITWTAVSTHPFALGYRWLSQDGTGVLDIPPAEVPLTHDVQPGETIHLQALLNVPDLPAGAYRLDWGMLQRDVLQFYERGWSDAETVVQVEGSPGTVAPPPVSARDDGQAPWVVGRLELWKVAVRLFASHPLLGVGPDNFRHYYGAELGLEGWDERIQANDLYLEILADLGIIGLVAFIWMLVGPLRAVLRAPMGIPLGVGLAIGAFLAHGLLDSFLAFTPTAFLFWLLLGFAQAQKPQVSGR